MGDVATNAALVEDVRLLELGMAQRADLLSHVSCRSMCQIPSLRPASLRWPPTIATPMRTSPRRRMHSSWIAYLSPSMTSTTSRRQYHRPECELARANVPISHPDHRSGGHHRRARPTARLLNHASAPPLGSRSD